MRNKKSYMVTFSNRTIWNMTAIIFICITILSIDSYAQLAKGQDKFLGNVIDNTIRSNFSKYWNQVTPGNAGKWGSVEGGKDYYNWTTLDKIYNYALTNNFIYKHHTLVWGQQYPQWITNEDSASQRAQVEEWIKLVGERYPEIDLVDVVNEPLHAIPPFADALGGSGKTGWDWVVTSFELARKYMPADAKLILNEYSVLHSNSVTDDFLEIVDTLRVRGLIDAVGIQGHYFEFKGAGYTNSITTIKANLDRLAATGLPVYISEFDINEPDDNVQLQNYQTYFPIFWEHPGVKGMTLWGYIQYEMWKADAYLITERYVERPAMQWLKTYLVSPFAPKIISPTGTVQRNPILVWSVSDSATSYNVQVTSSRTFANFIVDTTVTDTLLKLAVLDANKTYYWRVSASNDNGTSFFSSTGVFQTNDQTVDVEELTTNPKDFEMLQNYPNPFNPTTTITFSLPERRDVHLVLLDILGREVKNILDGSFEAGTHSIQLNASDLAAGIYLYRIETNSFVSTKKLILLK